jgi:hypothetical protein
MADTIRDQPQILALFADNTTGDISPQDLRDFVVSSMGVYGGMAVQDGAPVTQAGITSTPSKATFWNVDLPSDGVVADSTTDDDLTIPTNGGGDYEVSFDISFATATGASTLFEARLRINGAENGDGCHRTISSTAIGTTNFSTIVTLAAGDVLTIYVENSSGTNTLEIHDAHFWIERKG